MELKDKVAVVTGASSGVGREIALRLAKEGVRLALIARDKERLAKVSQEAVSLGSPKVQIYECDLRYNEILKLTVQKIVSDFGRVNILINNAGIWQKLTYLENMTEDLIDDVIATNLTAVIHTTRLVLPSLKEQSEAAIINISSRSGVTAQPGQTIYCASKWGVRGFTEVLKEDLRNTKVRVAGVYPAGIATDLLDKAGDRIQIDNYSDPKDIAETIVFMLSRPEKIWLHEVRIEY
jgi:NADP-dependent 3-hydroxy acid dehydrogenase YdfG